MVLLGPYSSRSISVVLRKIHDFLVIFCFLNLSHFDWGKINLKVVSISSSLILKKVEHLNVFFKPFVFLLLRIFYSDLKPILLFVFAF